MKTIKVTETRCVLYIKCLILQGCHTLRVLCKIQDILNFLKFSGLPQNLEFDNLCKKKPRKTWNLKYLITIFLLYVLIFRKLIKRSQLQKEK